MKKKKTLKSWASKREHKYYFFLNNYTDIAFTRCPKCDTITKKRMFCLFIHIKPKHFISINKSCTFCINCDLVIVRKYELGNVMAAMCEENNMIDIIGNEYAVLGTLDKFLHKEGKKGYLDVRTSINLFLPFKNYWTFEFQGGWQPTK